MKVKSIRSWFILILLSYIPIILFHILIRPIWFKSEEASTSITTTETIFTSLILPVYLLIINWKLQLKHSKLNYTYLANFLIFISCIYLAAYLHFKNWADSVGNIKYPDQETIEVWHFERFLGIFLGAIGFICICFFNRSRRNITE